MAPCIIEQTLLKEGRRRNSPPCTSVCRVTRACGSVQVRLDNAIFSPSVRPVTVAIWQKINPFGIMVVDDVVGGISTHSFGMPSKRLLMRR